MAVDQSDVLTFLQQARAAMELEHVDPGTVDRVINRLVYGHPDGVVRVEVDRVTIPVNDDQPPSPGTTTVTIPVNDDRPF